tara:strand:- start:123 stop:341 length:219 start_codon:yes stop_codon:yes gene_type:complete
MLQPSIVKFETVEKGDTFVWENQYFTRKDGTTFPDGPCKPVDHNAVSQRDRSCWGFEPADKVLLLTKEVVTV